MDENVDQQERSTTLTVKLNDARSRIRVKQDAAPAPEAKPKTFTVPTFTGTDKTFVYKCLKTLLSVTDGRVYLKNLLKTSLYNLI